MRWTSNFLLKRPLLQCMGQWLSRLLGYLLAIMALTWPLMGHMSSMLPGFPNVDSGDTVRIECQVTFAKISSGARALAPCHAPFLDVGGRRESRRRQTENSNGCHRRVGRLVDVMHADHTLKKHSIIIELVPESLEGDLA